MGIVPNKSNYSQITNLKETNLMSHPDYKTAKVKDNL